MNSPRAVARRDRVLDSGRPLSLFPARAGWKCASRLARSKTWRPLDRFTENPDAFFSAHWEHEPLRPHARPPPRAWMQAIQSRTRTKTRRRRRFIESRAVV